MVDQSQGSAGERAYQEGSCERALAMCTRGRRCESGRESRERGSGGEAGRERRAGGRQQVGDGIGGSRSVKKDEGGAVCFCTCMEAGTSWGQGQ